MIGRMFNLHLLVLAAGLPLLAAACASENCSGYPATRVDDVKDVLHGVEVRDPYRWLENAKAPEVQDWMKAQDALARGELKKLPRPRRDR